MGFDPASSRLVATPEAHRALATSFNVVDPGWWGAPGAYERRLRKYAGRGSAVVVPGLHVPSLTFSGSFAVHKREVTRDGSAATTTTTSPQHRGADERLPVTGLPRLLVFSYIESSKARDLTTDIPVAPPAWWSRFDVVTPNSFAFRTLEDPGPQGWDEDEWSVPASPELNPMLSATELYSSINKFVYRAYEPVPGTPPVSIPQPLVYDHITLHQINSNNQPPGRRRLASWLPHVFDVRDDRRGHQIYAAVLQPRGLPPRLSFLGFDDDGPFAGRGPTTREVEWFQPENIYDD